MHTLSDNTRVDPHLKVRGVSAGYGGIPIIRDVDLDVGRGEVVTIIGPNGAGKSTLLKAITGSLRCLSGVVELAGQRISGMQPHRIARRGVGYVPQSRDVFPSLTVIENLEMGGYQLRRSEVKPRIAEVLEILPKLAEIPDRAGGDLSGGERKMLAIGRLLMTRPTFMILDEPSAGLAPAAARRLFDDQITRVAEADTAVLLVEQRALDALAISTWAYVMAAGAIRVSEPAPKLLARNDLGEIFLGKAATHA